MKKSQLTAFQFSVAWFGIDLFQSKHLNADVWVQAKVFNILVSQKVTYFCLVLRLFAGHVEFGVHARIYDLPKRAFLSWS